MSTNSHDKWSRGQFTAASKPLPPTEVDCSGWEAEVPEHLWFTGRLETVTQALPAVEVDCSGWDATALELSLTLIPDTDPHAVFERATRLISLLDRYEKAGGGMGILLDVDRSKAVTGTVTLVLMSNDWGKRADVVKDEVTTFPGVAAVRVTLGSAA